MNESTRKQARDRLAKIEGQVKGIAKMIEQDAYCIDLLTQVNSVTSAIQGLGLLLLNDHIRTCVADSVRTSAGDEKLDELAAALKRFVR